MRWTKFIHLTDTHFVEPGERLYGGDPRSRLEAAVRSIATEHADAEFCLITGDLAHLGQPQAYAALREVLAGLPMPVQLLLGNHDDRHAFQACFPAVPRDADGFVQRALPFRQGLLLMLDTNEPGVSHGVFCERRRAWLAAQLAVSGEQPVWIAMHHPPFDIGLPSMDAIGLREADAFEAVIAPHRQRLRHLFFGHVHRPVSGSWLGVPFSTLRALNHQVALDFRDDGRIPGSFEPPAYAVVLADERQTVIHNHDFLDASERFLL